MLNAAHPDSGRQDASKHDALTTRELNLANTSIQSRQNVDMYNQNNLSKQDYETKMSAIKDVVSPNVHAHFLGNSRAIIDRGRISV